MIKGIVKIKEFFKNTVQPQKIDWLVLIAISLLLFLSHTYNDILITTRQGINLWNALFSGHILNFYSYNYNIVSGNVVYNIPQGAWYDFLVYVVYAIWNFPLWILEKFFKVDIMNSILCILWSKTMLIFFLGLSAKMINKICLELKINENLAKWCVFSYLSSTLVFSSLFIISQDNIISLSIMLIGLLMYLQEKTRKFIFWFALAIAFKYFALFLFIPLILLKEKRIFHILKYLISGMSLAIITKLIFSFDIATKATGKLQNDLYSFLIKNSLQLSIGNVSIFFLLTALFYIFCYYKKINSMEDLYKFSIYVSFLSFAIFFGFAYTYPYWSILLAPFTILLVFQNHNKFRFNLLIETAMTASFVMAQMVVFYWCYGIKTIKPMLLPKIFGQVSSLPKVFSIDHIQLLTKGGGTKNNILSALLAIFLACLITLAIVNFPKDNKNEISEDIVIDRSLFWGRLAISGGICLIPIAGYFAGVLYKLLFY